MTKTLKSPFVLCLFFKCYSLKINENYSYIVGISGLNTASTGSIIQGIPPANYQMELRNQLHEDLKMDVSNSQPYTQNLSNFMQNPLLHQPHHMHILNIHSHRSLTNSPISNPGSPGLDMIQEEIQIHSCPKGDPSINSAHPQISVTDVLGNTRNVIFNILKILK